jgi:hemolysin activation/secretion protein
MLCVRSEEKNVLYEFPIIQPSAGGKFHYPAWRLVSMSAALSLFTIMTGRADSTRPGPDSHAIGVGSTLAPPETNVSGSAGAVTTAAPGSANAAAQASARAAPAASSGAAPAPQHHFFVQQYRVIDGAHLIPRLAIEEAVYPYLGPYRVEADVEAARAALEKAYHDAGYQTVTVQIPPQQVKGGIITLQVVPQAVGRLRVTGSRYFSLDEIRREAPSLAEGTVPNFSQVERDIVGLNQNPDRRVTPIPSAGEIPGTVDFDLQVKDTPPWHGSLELNNRYSADTTELRINGSASYDNLWQLGHTVGLSFQLSPEDLRQVQVFSGFYSAPVPTMEWLTLMVEGTDQNSNVSTLGGIGVAGKGQVVGLRAIIALPPQKNFYHSVSLGIDYKHFDQDLMIGGTDTPSLITYVPISAAYSAVWSATGYETDFNASVTADSREIGSSEAESDNDRFGADGSFVYFRGDLSHTRDFANGVQGFAKVQGQISDKPLVNSEQFSGGGLGTVRGYLESEELGDNAVLGSAELRTPSLTELLGKGVDEWRFYLFGEGGILSIDQALPEQRSTFELASTGVGTRLGLAKHYNGSLDLGIPLLEGVQTRRYSPRVTFRVWADF